MKREETIDYIIHWIKDYVVKNGLRGLTIGISGGVDSALVSTLCARTGLPTLCLEMPIHQVENQSNRGRRHVEWLKAMYPNVEQLEVDLTDTFNVLASALPPVDSGDQELALANTRARLRMTTLYYYAGIKGYVVTGTGNKIEDFGIGFYTKYGDGGVDINPIADLMKTQVFELSKSLGILPDILTAKPTDGLFGDDRSDEEQIGATYPELEWAMQEAENGKKAGDFRGRQAEVFKIYERRHLINQHKWKPIPVCMLPKHLK